MASKAALVRLNREFVAIKKTPPPYIVATPRENDILEWHYVLTGPAGTPYEGGLYWGKLKFPSDYPFKPPSIYMITPNGRFKTNIRLCLSMSDFHPGTWNPAWSVSSILTGLLSFMLEETPTTGSMESNYVTRRLLAARSHEYNLQSKLFQELFPEICEDLASGKIPPVRLDNDPAVAKNTTRANSTGNNNDNAAAAAANGNRAGEWGGEWYMTVGVVVAVASVIAMISLWSHSLGSTDN